MKKYSLHYGKEGHRWPCASTNEGHECRAERAIAVCYDGTEFEALFFGTDCSGDAVIALEEFSKGGIMVTPLRVDQNRKWLNWEFTPELPKWPGGYPRLVKGDIVSSLIEGQTIGMQRARITQWVLEKGEWVLICKNLEL